MEERIETSELQRNERRTFLFLLLLFGAVFIRHLFDFECAGGAPYTGMIFSRFYLFLLFYVSSLVEVIWIRIVSILGMILFLFCYVPLLLIYG